MNWFAEYPFQTMVEESSRVSRRVLVGIPKSLLYVLHLYINIHSYAPKDPMQFQSISVRLVLAIFRPSESSQVPQNADVDILTILVLVFLPKEIANLIGLVLMPAEKT